MELLHERGKIVEDFNKKYKDTAQKFSLKLNNFIASTYQAKDNNNLKNIYKFPLISPKYFLVIFFVSVKSLVSINFALSSAAPSKPLA